MTISEPIHLVVEAESPNGILAIGASLGCSSRIWGERWGEEEPSLFFNPVVFGSSRAEFDLDPVRFGVAGDTTLEVIV